ncbi:MAG: tRNA pseudouridine(38-40) synthase TruA [Thermoplasmata archaeon]
MYLLKFAYDGKLFQGYAKQPGKYTVEGEIENCLLKSGIKAKIKSSSRTDKGVSAIGNVIGIYSNDNIKKIFGILTNAKNLYFYAYAEVNNDFNPRHAKERWYRYFVLDENYNVEKIKEKSKFFIGEHNFSMFSKKDRRNSIRKINSIEINKLDNFIIFDIKGESFLYNMVRRIVGFLLYGEGNPFELGGKFNVPPEGLILMDVSYNFQFNSYKIKKNISKIYQEIFVRQILYSTLWKIKEGRWGIEPQ